MSFYSISSFIEEFYPEYYGYETYPKSQCVTIHKVDEDWAYSAILHQLPLRLTV